MSDQKSRFAEAPLFIRARPQTHLSLTAAAPGQARAPRGTPIGGQWIDTPRAMLDGIRGLLNRGSDGPAPGPLVEPNPDALPRIAGAHTPVKSTDKDKNGTAYGDAADAANRIHDKAERNEPAITDAMTTAMGQGGMAPSGLEFRLKEQDSMARKIRDDAPIKGGIDQAAAGIFDANRYTGLSTGPDDYAASSQKTLDSLREQGYQVVQVKNTWNDTSNPYRGVNVKVVSPTGDQIELQFHTPDSHARKFEMHGLYEQQRLLPKGSPEWQSLNDQMWAISESLGVPPGIEDLH